MHTSIRSYRVKSGKSDELIEKVQSGFVPLIRKADGFIGYYVVDAGDGRIASISVFQDKAGAEQSTRSAADWVASNIADLVEGPPEVLSGDTRIDESAMG
jgi:quinol monooxygenase YgiN